MAHLMLTKQVLVNLIQQQQQQQQQQEYKTNN